MRQSSENPKPLKQVKSLYRTPVQSATYSRTQKVTHSILIGLASILIALCLVAPVLLLLLLFGINYTAEFVITGAWLLAVSLLAFGIWLLSDNGASRSSRSFWPQKQTIIGMLIIVMVVSGVILVVGWGYLSAVSRMVVHGVLSLALFGFATTNFWENDNSQLVSRTVFFVKYAFFNLIVGLAWFVMHREVLGFSESVGSLLFGLFIVAVALQLCTRLLSSWWKDWQPWTMPKIVLTLVAVIPLLLYTVWVIMQA